MAAQKQAAFACIAIIALFVMLHSGVDAQGGDGGSVIVRLVNGSSISEGRVEIRVNGTWGTICDPYFSFNDALVVCRMLGYATADRPAQPDAFGAGSYPPLFTYVYCSGTEQSILDCYHSSSRCTQTARAGVLCSDDLAVRLVDGGSDNEGRVEVYHSGEWGTVCDDYFTTVEANVVCLQLGYEGAATYHKVAHFGEGTGRIWIDNLHCSASNLTSIASCTHNGWEQHNCNHSEDVSVVCKLGNETYPPPLPVRIVDGDQIGGISAGRVEVQYNGEWGTVCDDGWDIEDANVFCRQLHFDGADLALEGNTFAIANESVSIIIEELLCHGNEDGISNCAHAPYGTTDCRHWGDAGVVCSDPSASTNTLKAYLTGWDSDSAGLVVLEYRGINGTVCDDRFDLADGDVICRMLGYSHALETRGAFNFFDFPDVQTSFSGPIWIDDLVCNGDERTIEDCSFPGWGINDCSHYEDVSLICANTTVTDPIRLVDGLNTYEGRVEVQHNGQWGTICDLQWDSNDAQVVCNQLGLTGKAQAVPRAQFGPGSGIIWQQNVDCSGTENFIDHCHLGTWGNTSCSHSQDAGVVCTPSNFSLPVRLVNGSWPGEGRLEVKKSAAWGTVCDTGFGSTAADVICRQLGYYGASSVLDNSYFGPGDGPLVATYVYCSSSASELGDCYLYTFSSTDSCSSHQHDVGIRCLENKPTELPVRLVGGPTDYQGRVEVLLDGVWGTVCDDLWSDADATVICRQLGFQSFGARAVSQAYFGEGSGPIVLDDVQCSGGEQSLLECNSSALLAHNCRHYEDAGVICPASPATITRYPVRLSLTEDNHDYSEGLNEGRVEIFYNGTWGTICDDSFGFFDAQVVCRQLGFQAAVRAFPRAYFGQGTSHPILLTGVACTGSESEVGLCAHSAFGDTSGCTHANDVGVACTNFVQDQYPIRLVDGGGSANSGRLQVLYNNTWGTVCDHFFGTNEVNVVCRQLGFSEGGQVARRGEFRPSTDSEPIWLDEVQCHGNEGHLDDCDFPGWGYHEHCTHFEDVGVHCAGQQLSVRLVNGNNSLEGRVEVNYNGTWGTVCDDYWSHSDAQVVCRELGFLRAIDAPKYAKFGEGHGPIWMDNVACVGTESSIFECSAIKWNNSNCVHAEDAGVICSNETREVIPVQVRLSGGHNVSEGRVEVQYNGTWGTVCDDYWSLQDANVVCRMLGFGSAVRATNYAFFGEGSGPIWLDNVDCLGTESSITECDYIGWDKSNCWHGEDAGVVCYVPGPLIRLAAGNTPSEGRVEVFYNGTWGTVCDDSADLDVGDVVCRELGHERALRVYGSAVFGPGSGKIWLDDVSCDGSETSIYHCDHSNWGEHNCFHSEDLSVVCTDIPINDYPVRLVDGNSTAGRVEIYNRGEWGSICDDGWTLENARVICRSLGYQGVWSASTNAQYGQGTGLIWLDDVHCNGTEQFIQDCGHAEFGEHNCQHFEDAGVSCIAEEFELRLVNGTVDQPYIGRLEILHEGVWGTICDDFFDMNSAAVACRMLGFGGALAMYPGGQLSQGDDTEPIWLDDVSCLTGNESTFAECGHSEFGINNCGHSEDVGISCYRACPDVDIPFGSFEGDFVPGASLSFSCNHGYALVGVATLECRQDSSWNGTIPTCQRACDVLTLPGHTKAEYSGRFNGSVVTISCDNGYMLKGKAALTCVIVGDSAFWDGSMPTCLAATCSGTTIPNGVVVPSGPVQINQKATVQCDVGYKLTGSSIVKCVLDEGQTEPTWNPPISGCERITCPPAPVITNGVVVPSGPVPVNQIATVQCDVGYKLKGSPTVKCVLATGQTAIWNGDFPSCEIVTCPGTHVSNGVVVPSTPVPVNQTATVQCGVGYKLTGSSTVQCVLDEGQTTATWNPPISGCDIITCPSNHVSNGVAVPSGPVPVNQTATVQCDVGYKRTGISIAKCVLDPGQTAASWNGPFPSCELMTCPKPPISNGTLVPSTPAAINQTATVQCDVGYKLTGSPTVKCVLDEGQTTATWNPPISRCEMITCPETTIPHGVSVPSGPVAFNQTATVQCDGGYKPTGTPTVQCVLDEGQTTATWDGTFAECRTVTCPEAVVPNGVVVPSGLVPFYQIATVQCNDGYKLKGLSTVNCQLDAGETTASWNGTFPSCESESAGGIAIAASNVPAVIGALVAVVVIILLVVIGVAVVAWQFGKWHAKKKMYSPVSMRADNEAVNLFTDEDEEDGDEGDEEEREEMFDDDETPLDI